MVDRRFNISINGERSLPLYLLKTYNFKVIVWCPLLDGQQYAAFPTMPQL